MRRFSLRNNVLITSLTIMLIMALSTSLVYVSPFRSTAESLSDQLLIKSSEANLTHIKTFLEQPLIEAERYAQILAATYQNLERDQVIQLMMEWLEARPEYLATYALWEENAFDQRDEEFQGDPRFVTNGAFASYIFLGDDDTATVEGELDDYYLSDYYAVPLSTQQPYITEPEYFEVAAGEPEELMICLTYPIVVDGKSLGIVGVDYALDTLVQTISGYTVLDDGYCSLITQDGTILASRRTDLLDENFLTQIADSQQRSSVQQLLQRENSRLSLTHATPDSETMMTAIETFALGDSDVIWALYSTVPHASVVAASQNSIIIGSIVTVVVFLLGAIALYLLLERVIVRPINLQMSELNRATDNLGRINSQLNSTSQSLSDNSSELSSATTECSATVDQLNQLALGNAEKIDLCSESAQTALRVTAAGAEQTQLISRSLDELERSSEEIQNVVNMIEDIAFQTKILALNAAIEAARAGEAGKGFSVVAAEVGSLSQNSSEAAQRASDIVQSNIALARQNADEGRLISAQLDDARKQSEAIATLLQQINLSTQEQNRGLQQTSIAIQQIEQSAVQSAEESRRSFECAEELNDDAELLIQVAGSLDYLVFGQSHQKDEVSPKALPLRSAYRY